MNTIHARNVNHAFEQGLAYLKECGIEQDSRNGPVYVAPGPVMTVYQHPEERVLFSPARDANPFFHLFEAMYFLGGGNRVEPLAHYAKNMREFSDDGEHLHGSYGFRWREWFGFDQLPELVKHLREIRDSRRAVLAMWSPGGDLIASEGAGGMSTKDLPCNTHCYLRVREGHLDLTTMARSNDMVWGAYGANAVHFSFLLEWLALAIGKEPGKLYQFSNDFHIYKHVHQFHKLWHEPQQSSNLYSRGVEAMPLASLADSPSALLADCERLVEAPLGCAGAMKYYTRFFEFIVRPMLSAHHAWRVERPDIDYLSKMPDCDWKTAGRAWLERRGK